jgi:hypothetical protein
VVATVVATVDLPHTAIGALCALPVLGAAVPLIWAMPYRGLQRSGLLAIQAAHAGGVAGSAEAPVELRGRGPSFWLHLALFGLPAVAVQQVSVHSWLGALSSLLALFGFWVVGGAALYRVPALRRLARPRVARITSAGFELPHSWLAGGWAEVREIRV